MQMEGLINMDDTLPVKIRPAINSDYPYILASFTRELHKVVPYNFMSNKSFFPYYTKLINAILYKSNITVACLEDNEEDIAGYLIASDYNKDNLIVYWGQTKAIFRRLGIMKLLLEPYNYKNKNLICPHYFNLFKKLRESYSLIFDPTILEGIL